MDPAQSPCRYTTVARDGRGEVREKMSRFMAFAHRASSPAEARDIVTRYTNEYHDARHVCWAWMLGAARDSWQINDNGEPSGTAGKPILGQINSLGLTNVVVIVVRYFGGIKLGTPGLIAAYRAAARAALDDAGTLEGCVTADVTLTFAYPAINTVMTAVKQSECPILHRAFDNTCTVTLRVPLDHIEELRRRLGTEVTFETTDPK